MVLLRCLPLLSPGARLDCCPPKLIFLCSKLPVPLDLFPIFAAIRKAKRQVNEIWESFSICRMTFHYLIKHEDFAGLLSYSFMTLQIV